MDRFNSDPLYPQWCDECHDVRTTQGTCDDCREWLSEQKNFNEAPLENDTENTEVE